MGVRFLVFNDTVNNIQLYRGWPVFHIFPHQSLVLKPVKEVLPELSSPDLISEVIIDVFVDKFRCDNLSGPLSASFQTCSRHH
jgi:hypothetical protein